MPATSLIKVWISDKHYSTIIICDMFDSTKQKKKIIHRLKFPVFTSTKWKSFVNCHPYKWNVIDVQMKLKIIEILANVGHI